ncbi:putative F-box protein PP2-B12 [Triticum dicoccoides]|uniref:putative F-box protein PP2-B12 n=1 Tax=Triticum dicoccoides TaxID=85692 RepID=UPI001891E096|nr:putative F-box protein PP2-B12 [Triticum dicoccoides]
MDCAAAAAAIYRLPEECVAHAIAMTTPGDALSSSAVSPAFRAAADSDAVWDRFLPRDHADVLARADDAGDHRECSMSNKELFTRLCSRPVLLDGATMSFGLDRRSGAKCWMLSARALSIVWGDDPSCWTWTADLPGSRFPEVAELVDVCWLEITGKLQLSLLTPRTTYAAYLVYAITDDSYGLECNIGILPPKATVTVVVSGNSTKPTSTATSTSTENTICLQHMQGEEETAMHRRRQEYVRPRNNYGWKLVREADMDIRCPRRRGDDGWTEVELGEFAVAGEEDGVVEVSLKEVECRRWKRGLIVQGIEIRPKHTN